MVNCGEMRRLLGELGLIRSGAAGVRASSGKGQIMTQFTRRFAGAAGAASLLLLAACGGGSGSAAGVTQSATGPTAQSDPVDYFNQVVGPGYQQYESDLVGNSYTGTTGLPNTAFKGMPTGGTATYRGYALVIANADGTVAGQPKIGVEGTATLTADFGNGTLAGSATNFVGTTISGKDSKTGAYQLAKAPAYYAGTVTIKDGCIGVATACSNVTRPNEFSANYSGTLTGEGNKITTNGQVLGEFKGTPIQGAVLGTNTGATTLNGAAVPGAFAALLKP
jgi:hypothetical protein